VRHAPVGADELHLDVLADVCVDRPAIVDVGDR
jgi:hypothetical protein